jgi:hypothetical protein
MQVMGTHFTMFLDRVAERMAAVFSKLISSRIGALYAEARAEQESRLEELALDYEMSGMAGVATNLRRRATKLASIVLTDDGKYILDRVVENDLFREEHEKLSAELEKLRASENLHASPIIAAALKTGGKKRRKKAPASLPAEKSPLSSDN